ncbi:hypothetical protein [Corynebacterium freiburgense]|nr:hypothetical protein [Corynebacterium freiburgense]WJZ03358.1 hypothetical protein CFREI_10420 [Corynebacterium freiburgense]
MAVGAVTRFVLALAVLEERDLHTPPYAMPSLDLQTYPALVAGIELGQSLGDPLEFIFAAVIDGLLRRLGLCNEP